MIEVTGDLWKHEADYRVITTNGTVRKDGACVMGRGCAREAAKLFPRLPYQLGESLKAHGNNVKYFSSYGLLTFPVKHNWYEKADIELITRSAIHLAAWAEDDENDAVFVLPRPGCGNGKLKWDDVKKVLTPILDDRFHVITFK